MDTPLYIKLYLDLPSKLVSSQSKRKVIIAYIPTDLDNEPNPLHFKSQSLKRLLMYLCGPRRGSVGACPLGARTTHPDAHVSAGI